MLFSYRFNWHYLTDTQNGYYLLFSLSLSYLWAAHVEASTKQLLWGVVRGGGGFSDDSKKA